MCEITVWNLLMDFWKPHDKFFQQQGVVAKKIIEGHKRHFYAFLHFQCRLLIFEAITCHISQLEINCKVF